MKRSAAVLLLAGSILLAGCSAMLERNYVSVEKSTLQNPPKEDKTILRAENKSDLYEVLLSLVEEGKERGFVRMYQYSGDLERELPDTCREVGEKTPLGLYAVTGITYDLNRIISYYEVEFRIGYRRSAEQITSIQEAFQETTVNRELASALTGYKPELALHIYQGNWKEGDVRNTVRTLFEQMPEALFEIPEVTVFFYPQMGIERIMEITFSYAADPATMRQWKAAVEQRGEELTRDLSGLGDLDKARALYDRLTGQTAFSSESSSNLYEALVNGSADSEGCAYAFEYLCRISGLPCTVVRGQRDGTPHTWNKIMLEKQDYYVDVTRGALPEGADFLMLPDAEFNAVYHMADPSQ